MSIVSMFKSKVRRMKSCIATTTDRFPRRFTVLYTAMIVMLLCSLACPSATFKSQEIDIPINAADAENLGSLHLILIFDPSLLQVVSVDTGTLTGNSLFRYNLDLDGQVVIGMADSNGINGSGILAIVRFMTINRSSNDTQLRLENIIAHHAFNLEEINTEATSGSLSFQRSQPSFTSPTLTFLPFEE